jgi:predicted neuraminidase
MNYLTALMVLTLQCQLSVTPQIESELVFPLNQEHNHAPGIVEFANGDLLVSWYRGSGERSADDVRILGAKKKKGSTSWSDPFLLADTPGFPDCNTCMMLDSHERLWLFWPTILANSWESALTNYRVSSDYAADGPPKWDRSGMILLKPEDFSQAAIAELDRLILTVGKPLTLKHTEEISIVKGRLKEKLYQRMGWQPRCKPTVLPSGRILLPLYSDTYSLSLMAMSDDQGETWYASKLLLGFGSIQPSVLRRNNGTLIAYMRENGFTGHVRVCESTDDGLTWGEVGMSELPNPGSGLDGIRLRNGHWLLVYNDTTEEDKERDRSRLAVSISEDEGLTWKWTTHLEAHDSGDFHYPAVIQGSDDTIHVVYSYFVAGGKSMKHCAFPESFVKDAASTK